MNSLNLKTAIRVMFVGQTTVRLWNNLQTICNVGSGWPRHMCDTVWNPDTTLRLLSTFSLQSWWSSFSCLPCMLQYLNKKCFTSNPPFPPGDDKKHKPQTKQSIPVSCQCCQDPPPLKSSLQIEPGIWEGKPKQKESPLWTFLQPEGTVGAGDVDVGSLQPSNTELQT